MGLRLCYASAQYTGHVVMPQSRTKLLHIYMFGLWLAVVIILFYQVYSVWNDEIRVSNRYGEVYDRQKQCKDTASGVHSCPDPMCLGYLSTEGLRNFSKCLNKTWPEEVDRKYINNGCCHFLRGERRETVMLASYPGSGNTWVRGLLQKSTGICTGSVYCDIGIRRSGFIGESIADSTVLVVKTHRLMSWMVHKPTIYVIRHPAKAIVSYWNFLSTPRHSHKISLPSSKFGNDSDWNRFFHNACKNWKHSVLSWSSRDVPLLVISYEDLLNNTLREVLKMMKFLYVPFEGQSLHKQVTEGFSVFHRHSNADIEHFTDAQWQYLQAMLADVHRELQTTGQSVLASYVHSYIQSSIAGQQRVT